MRRQETEDGQLSVWARSEVRPDPFNLPVEYNAPIFGRGECDQDSETIIVSREEVSFSAGSNGVRVPMHQYLGVAMTVAATEVDAEVDQKAAVIVVLEHEDPALNVPLFVSWQSEDVVATWHAWAKALGVPLRIRGTDGVSSEINAEMNNVHVFPSTPRRLPTANRPKRSISRTMRRSSSPLSTALHAGRVEKVELFARQ